MNFCLNKQLQLRQLVYMLPRADKKQTRRTQEWDRMKRHEYRQSLLHWFSELCILIKRLLIGLGAGYPLPGAALGASAEMRRCRPPPCPRAPTPYTPACL